ncbi:MAG: prepilin-type N-terminal cleavage/methylation domain-containing protein [Rhodocyclaceae bacterium]|nr:prepilin-type N-terminal cleavage/methylation domain-containing protein [Rhodocyclaceae bacterium]
MMNKKCGRGFTYLEVLVALLVFSIALIPAMESIQNSLRAVRQDAKLNAAGGERNVTDGQAVINKMESLLAMSMNENFGSLAYLPSGRITAHATLSDALGIEPRCLVYTSWFKPEATLEADRYVTTKTHLLWVKVVLDGSGVSATTLVLIP